jgi:basic amino acid/polyamine antiporter, APA family
MVRNKGCKALVACLVKHSINEVRFAHRQKHGGQMNMDSSSQRLFVRPASGLVREFSALDTFIFNTLGFSLGLVLATTPTFLGSLYPSANIYWVLTIGVILAVFNGITYGLFAAAMPRSGGDYIYIGRTLGPMAGFVANWGFSWSQFFGIGVYTAWCVQTALGPALSTFGYSVGSRYLIELGTKVSSPIATWCIGTILLVSVLLISIAGLKVLKRFLNLLFVVALAGTLAMILVLLFSSHEELISAFNKFMLTNGKIDTAYDYIIALGKEKGLITGQPTNFLSSLLALPVGYWVFIGFTYSVYVGGEIKEPQRSQSLAIIGSLVFGYLLYMVAMGRYYQIVGYDFNNAVALIQTAKDNPLPVGGSMSFFAGILTNSAFINALMGIGSFLWYYLLLFVMATICVRNIFAWSFDQITPKALTRITSSNGSPWVATLLIVAIAEVFLTLHVFVGIAFVNYIAMFSVCFLITGIAAIVFPFKRKHLFDTAPSIVRRSIAGVPLIVLAGIGNVILFIIVLYSSLTNPGVSGVQGWLPTAFLLVVYGAGCILYLIASALKKKKGIDFKMLYVELPPE